MHFMPPISIKARRLLAAAVLNPLHSPVLCLAERRLLVGDALPQRPKRKPTIKPLPQSGLLNRLQAFLPTLEAANAGLEQQLAAGLPQADVAMERGRCGCWHGNSVST
jgi:hypothetical protein